MAETIASEPVSGRGIQLKRLAEADYEDHIVIAEAQKRIKLRDIERETLAFTDNHFGSGMSSECDHSSDLSYQDEETEFTKDCNEPEQLQSESSYTDIDGFSFQTLLSRFRDACARMDAEDALDCPTCGEYPPEDPILTDCLCIYCMECFSELLVKHANSRCDRRIKCAAYQDERIQGYIILTTAQWGALLAMFDQHTEAQDIARGFCQSMPDDLQILWETCQHTKEQRKRDGEHSRISPDLSKEESRGTVANVQAELSSDGYDLKSNRSDGYETESVASGEPHGAEISQSGYIIDPRHIALVETSSTDSLDDLEDPEDQTLTLSELDELLLEERPLESFMPNLGLEPDDASPSSAIPIDLTESSDGAEPNVEERGEVASAQSMDGTDGKVEEQNIE